MKAGWLGAQTCLLLTAMACLAAAGVRGAAEAALAGAVALIFFATGQAVQIISIAMSSTFGLGLTLASYVVRVVGLGLVYLWMQGRPGLLDSAGRWSLLAGFLTTTAGWLAGVLVRARRQRVSVFDAEYVPPPGWEG